MHKQPKHIADLGIFTLTGNEYVVSDTHLGHSNCIKFCNRPFKTIDEMDYELIRRWNAVVKPDDVIFHLGDFAFKGPTFKRSMLAKLNGYKVLIKGNHDAGRPKMIECGFDEVYLIGEGTFEDGRTFSMSHVPLPLLAKTADIHLCGHIHEKWAFIAPNIYNVGCDQWGFVPQKIDHVIKHAENRQKRLPIQHTMDTWFEKRDEQLTQGMYGTTKKGGLAE